MTEDWSNPASPRWRNVQPRYVAYCITLGAGSAEEMIARDAVAYPGGKMAGFMVWIDASWRNWDKERGVKPGSSRSASDHTEFTAWLLQAAKASWIC